MVPRVAVMIVAVGVAVAPGAVAWGARGAVTSGRAPNTPPTSAPSARQPDSQRPITGTSGGYTAQGAGGEWNSSLWPGPVPATLLWLSRPGATVLQPPECVEHRSGPR